MVNAQEDEVRSTVRHVVAHDLPLAELFVGRSTFRGPLAELEYRREAFEVRGGAVPTLADVASWPAEGAWAPREELVEGEHAGVLTTPALQYDADDRRQRLRDHYLLLWCKEPASRGVTTAQMLSLGGGGNLQIANEGWEKLAQMPVCGNCHARLDYGMQFFAGFTDVRLRVGFWPDEQPKGHGKLFGDGPHDLRAEPALTPRGFAAAAVAQPEFAACMVDDVVQHVFAHRATPEDVAPVARAFAARPTLRTLLRAALVRYAARWADPEADAESRPPPPPSSGPTEASAEAAAADPIVVTGALRGALDRSCSGCHAFATVPRAVGVRMLHQVGFGSMPPGEPLGAGPRRELAGLLASALFADPRARDEALAYATGGARSPAVHDLEASLASVRAAAGAPDAGAAPGWDAVESGLPPDLRQLTPGFTAIAALEALRACKARGAVGATLEPCVRAATSPGGLINGNLPHPRLPEPRR